MQQVTDIESIFRKYFSYAIIPSRIIELGGATGVFTKLLYRVRKEINNDFDFITIDQLLQVKNIPKNMHTYEMDIFSNVEFIGSLIKYRTLVLCDDGNKVLEVKTFVPYLKQDCVIMAHDYAFSKKDGNKYWWCCEITWDDVKNLGLELYHQDLMETGGWLSLKPSK